LVPGGLRLLQRLLRFWVSGDGWGLAWLENLIMAKGYRPVDRDQMMLLPPDLREWLPARHFVWFLLAVVEQLDLSACHGGRRLGSVGREGYDPRMLLALLIYGYATGQRSSRRMEELCHTDVAFRVICAQDAPDHTTIARFRQVHQEAVGEVFVQVLQLAGEAGLGRVGLVAVDGTRIAANAAYAKNRRRSWLREQVGQMLAEADRVDAEEDARFGPEDGGGQVDEQWADPATRTERIKAALARAEQMVDRLCTEDEVRVTAQQSRVQRWADRLAAERAGAAERLVRYHDERAAAQAQGHAGVPRRPAPPVEQAHQVRRAKARLTAHQARLAKTEAAAAEARAAQDPVANLTDPDSGWMPTGKGWIQGYNTQLAVSDDQIVMAVKVTNATIDIAQFEPMMAAAAAAAEALNRGRDRAGAAPESIGLVVADAGYFSEHNLTVPGPDRLIAGTKRHRLEAEFHSRRCPAADSSSDPIAAMKARLQTPDGIAAYRRRGVTVEPVNGHLKDRYGLRQFTRRGIRAAQAEAELAATTANLIKIWRHGA
jgi:transposase